MCNDPDKQEFNLPDSLRPAYRQTAELLAQLVRDFEYEAERDRQLSKAQASTVVVHMLLRHAAMSAILARVIDLGGEPDKRLWDAACNKAWDSVLKDLDGAGLLEESDDAQD